MRELTKQIASEIERVFSGAGKSCVCCGAELYSDAYLCVDCQNNLPFNVGEVCEKCGRAQAERYPVCLECKAHMPAFHAARSAFRYEGEIVRLIKKFKTGGKWLGAFFSAQLLPLLLSEFSDADFLTCVPMTEQAYKKRGYNQSLVLARELAERSGFRLEPSVLVKTRETSAQKYLSAKERAKNLTGCFRVHERTVCKGKKIVLVDDVMTTGATGSVLAQLLLGAGAERVDLLTVAGVRAPQSVR